MVAVVHMENAVSVAGQPVLFTPEALTGYIHLRVDVSVGENDHRERSGALRFDQNAADLQITAGVGRLVSGVRGVLAEFLADLEVAAVVVLGHGKGN